MIDHLITIKNMVKHLENVFFSSNDVVAVSAFRRSIQRCTGHQKATIP